MTSPSRSVLSAKQDETVQSGRLSFRQVRIGRTSLLYLILVIYCLLVIGPFLIVVSASVHPDGLPRLLPDAITLDHYKQILGQQRFLLALRNSILITVVSTVLSVFISALAGYAFSRYAFRGKRIIMGIVLGIFMIPISVNIIPIFVLMQRLGWLNTLQGLVIPYQALILPLNIWLLKNFFDTIPPQLEEAAMVDGATRWTAFWRVTLPLTWPGLAVAGIFAFRFAWNDFIFSATFNSSASMKTWQAAMFSFLGQNTTDWGPLTAGVVIGMLPILILFVIFQRRFIEGLTLGAVK